MYVNIYDLLDAKMAQRRVPQFETRRSLMKHLEYYPERRYPLEAAKENRLMSAFLVELGG